MNKKVIIIGGEGNGGVVASCIEDNRKRFNDHKWEVAGFVNDYEKTVCGYPVLGLTDDVKELLKNPEYYFHSIFFKFRIKFHIGEISGIIYGLQILLQQISRKSITGFYGNS